MSSLSAGAFDTFSVEFLSSAAGTHDASISIANNDSNENPYNFAIMAIVGVPEINVSGKGVTIVDGDTTPSTADHTNFGTVPLNTIASRTFTVTNTGSDTLWLGTTPSLPAGFRLGANRLVASLAAGASDTFVVEFPSVTAGTFGGDVVIYNNDANESPYNFTIIAITGSPEIHVSGKGQSIVDGDITPSTADDTDFGTVLINTWVFHTFTVKNTGSDTLWLGTPSVTGGVFRLAANSLGQSLAPNASGTFVVSFMASVANTYIGQIALYNSDSNESPYNFTVLAKAGVPDIEVSGNGKVIVNPDTAPEVPDDTDFGTMLFNAPGVTHIFTVTNTGTTTLKPSIKAIPPGFKLGANRLAASIEPTKSDTFEITLESSTTLGVKSGTVIIDSNDPDESPFKFDIKGVIKGYEISGTIKYDTNPSQAKPVRGALVTAWNNDGGGDTSLGTAYTDDNGRYTITTTTDADNVYIRVYAQTAPAGNGAGQVKRAIKVEDGISGANFFYDFYPLPDPSLSSSHSQILGADVIIPDTQYSGQAFWAFDAAVTATRFHATLPERMRFSFRILLNSYCPEIRPAPPTAAIFILILRIGMTGMSSFMNTATLWPAPQVFLDSQEAHGHGTIGPVRTPASQTRVRTPTTRCNWASTRDGPIFSASFAKRSRESQVQQCSVRVMDSLSRIPSKAQRGSARMKNCQSWRFYGICMTRPRMADAIQSRWV